MVYFQAGKKCVNPAAAREPNDGYGFDNLSRFPGI
jgi:hypothetical protein